MLEAILQRIKIFRDRIYENILYRADACLDLLDSLATNVNATSPVKLSLNKSHRRGYTSQTDVLDNFNKGGKNQEDGQLDILLSLIEPAVAREFHLMAIDCTPAPRVKSSTLEDRTVIYSPNPVPGNKPISIGHKYSLTSYLPEKSSGDPPWTLPLKINRVKSDEKETLVGAAQLNQIIAKIQNKEPEKLCVSVVDSGYCRREFIHAMHGPENKNALNTASIIRATGGRVFYRQPTETRSRHGNLRGHERWYGDEFRMLDKGTWGAPSQCHVITRTTKEGKEYTETIMAWDNMLMRDKDGIPMHKHPFTLVHIVVTSEGKAVFHKPMWLTVFGERRAELSHKIIYDSYLQRYDLEHGFRMQKRNLLADKLQTPSVQHEENWWAIVMLAYAMLFSARHAVEVCPNPWEKYLPELNEKDKMASPTQAQRGFHKLLTRIGTPALLPKARGNPLGRKRGEKQPHRARQSLIVKRSKDIITAQSPP